MSSARVRAHVFVSGKVQGVYYRQNTKETAERNGLAGWVRNLPDGRVEAVFEGDRSSVEKAIDWCHKGPAGGRVDHVDVKLEKYTGEFRDFRISY